MLNKVDPRYFLLENVKMSKKSEEIISEMLGVKPIRINSELVSAQMRDRLYWTNIKGVGQPVDRKITLSEVIENGIVDRDKSFCIDANYFKGGNLKNYFEKHRRHLVFLNEELTEFRKLTPAECERLQTVPEGYTAHTSNTQRYKMLGNGWTVDVIAHLFNGMKRNNDEFEAKREAK